MTITPLSIHINRREILRWIRIWSRNFNSTYAIGWKINFKILRRRNPKIFSRLKCKVILCLYCENQIDPVTWWRSTEFRQKSFISLSLATKREIQKSETMASKTIFMRSFWYQKFEDPTIHVTVATCAKFWGLKLQNGFTHARLRGRDPIFRYYPIIRTCSFIWASQNKFSTTLQISGFISTESHYQRQVWKSWKVCSFTSVSE